MKSYKPIKLNISQRLGDHFIQGILIFFSVFLAFWLTDYRESQKNSKTLETSINYIASEIGYNHLRVEAIFDYHTQLLKEIDSLSTQNDTDWRLQDGSELKNWTGLQTPFLRSTAYQTYLNSNIIDHVEFEMAKSLTRIYYFQSIIERLDNSLIESIITDSDELTSLSKLRSLIKIYLSTLPNVMIEYQQARKEWLHYYGYDMEIESDELNKEVGRRIGN